MKQWELAALGEPIDQLELVDVEVPVAGPGELLVQTAAVGLMFPDVLSCRGEYQVPTPDRFRPGGETSGIVVAVGSGVERFEVGQRVVLFGGGLAEYVTVKAASCWLVPDDLDLVKAAAIPVNYGTAWFALHQRAHIQAGEWLLVTGAAGGTGTAAIQLGRAAGAKIVAVAGGETKTQILRDLGVDAVIDHLETPAWVDAVREITGGGVDVAFDPVGGDTFHQVRRCMGWDGRLCIIGFVAGIPEMATNHILLKNYSLVGVHWGASLMRDPASLDRQMTSVLQLAANGEVDPPLFPPVAFEDAARAIQDLADRNAYAKVVVTTGV